MIIIQKKSKLNNNFHMLTNKLILNNIAKLANIEKNKDLKRKN